MCKRLINKFDGSRGRGRGRIMDFKLNLYFYLYLYIYLIGRNNWGKRRRLVLSMLNPAHE